jgi:hypothetical protein
MSAARLYLSAVKRHYKRLIVGCWIVMGVATTVDHAWGSEMIGIAGGTFIVATAPGDFAIIGADSRQGNPGPRRTDSFCKIIPLSNDLLFAASGQVEVYLLANGRTIFDAYALARNAQTISGDIDHTAEAWGRLVVSALEQVIIINKEEFFRAVPPDKPEPVMITGIFVGDRQAPATHFVYVIYRKSTGALFAEHRVAQGVFASGYEAEIQEFLQNTTPRAQALHAAPSPSTDQMTRNAHTIEGLVKAVIEWNTDGAVGGEPIVITLRRGENWKWFRRPTFCPGDYY